MLEIPKELGYYMPAEWEKHSAVWLAWPYGKITFPNILKDVEEKYCEIIKALEIDLNEFFKDIGPKNNGLPLLIKRKSEYEHFEKEHAIDFHYQRIFTQFISQSTVDIVILELGPNASRPLVETEAYEYKYVLYGDIEYQFNEKRVVLNQGDSMLFDGRVPHTPKNLGSQTAAMLVIYFFEEKK